MAKSREVLEKELAEEQAQKGYSTTQLLGMLLDARETIEVLNDQMLSMVNEPDDDDEPADVDEPESPN